MIDEVADRGPYQAHNVLGHTKTFFNWAIERGIYGVETSPCDRIKPGRLIGRRVPRQRVLSDPEIKAFWRAAGRLGYPFGTLFQMLLLTGQRRSEVAEARWREFDLPNRVWTVPPERFKSDSNHIVPLTDDVIALLEKLPRWNGGDALFSTTSGTTPVNGFSYQKLSLDSFMKGALGDIELKRFVLHDLRRTTRTRLSSLKVPDAVAEMVIGHGRKGIQRVYDQHQYVGEMREALEAWNAKLREIVA
jgi:integrase